MVPLGGRHVNHFWRLVHDLAIPHLTLLDLNQETVAGTEYLRELTIKKNVVGAESEFLGTLSMAEHIAWLTKLTMGLVNET